MTILDTQEAEQAELEMRYAKDQIATILGRMEAAGGFDGDRIEERGKYTWTNGCPVKTGTKTVQINMDYLLAIISEAIDDHYAADLQQIAYIKDGGNLGQCHKETESCQASREV